MSIEAHMPDDNGAANVAVDVDGVSVVGSVDQDASAEEIEEAIRDLELELEHQRRGWSE
jgi:hypothetical protein